MKDFLTLNKQLCFAVYETASEFNKLYSNILQQFELTYPQYLVLLALWEKDGISMKELGAKLKLGIGTLNPMITRMELKGWIRKERSTEDERKVIIFLEKKAIQEKQFITKQIATAINACNIDESDYVILMEQLKSLQRKLRSTK